MHGLAGLQLDVIEEVGAEDADVTRVLLVQPHRELEADIRSSRHFDSLSLSLRRIRSDCSTRRGHLRSGDLG